MGENHILNFVMTYHRDLEIVAVLYHHHPWTRQIDVYDSSDHLMWSRDGSPFGDGRLDFFDEPVAFAAGDSVKIGLQGRADFANDLTTPTAVNIFAKFNDGYDRIETTPDELYTVPIHQL